MWMSKKLKFYNTVSAIPHIRYYAVADISLGRSIKKQ